MATATQPTAVPAHKLVFEPSQLPKLRSNNGPFLDQDGVGWMQETSIDTPFEDMQRRFNEDGYVFVKGVIPREDVLDMRQAYFEHIAPTGILKPGTSPRDGIFNSDLDPVAHHGNGGRDLPADLDKVDRLASAHAMPTYNAFLAHPKLRQFVRDLMGWKQEVILKRSLLRHNVPNGFSTGIHYDKIFLRAGAADFLTAWVPIGDVTAAGGGLMYLERSHDVGRAMERRFAARARADAALSPADRVSGFNTHMARDGQLSHDAAAWTREFEAEEAVEKQQQQRGQQGQRRRRWLVANYEAGDVVFHTPYMIHGAVKNDDDQGRIRLSTDVRFYEEGADLDERWMKSVWTPDDGL